MSQNIMTEQQYNTAKLVLASGGKPKKLADTIGVEVEAIMRVRDTTNYKQYTSDDTPTENILPQYWTDLGNAKK